MKVNESQNFSKFRLKEDWNIEIDILGVKEKRLVFEKGHIFEPNDEGLYIINTQYGNLQSTESDMEKSQHDGELMFEKIEQEFKINTSEIENFEDDEIKNWRIQLDVKTSFNNLKRIEKFLNENIPYYL